MNAKSGLLLLSVILSVPALIPGCSGEGDVTNVYTMPQLVQIRTTYLPDASQAQYYSVTLQAAGGSGTYLWSIQPGGSNDSWLSLDQDTGELTGTSSDVLSVVLNVKVEDSTNPANYDMARFTFDVAQFTPSMFFVTTNPLPAASLNQAYSQTLQVSGGSGSYTFSKRTGGVNDGWISVGAATGALTGTPAATGATQIILRATDDANPLNYAQKTYTVEIKTVAITTSTLPGAYQDTAYSQTLAAQGGSTPYAWSTVPGGVNYAWLSLNAGSGLLSGTPTSANLGDVKIIVRIDDNGGNYDIRLFEFSVTVYDPPVIASTTLKDAFVGDAYSASVAVSGGSGPLKYTITGGSNHEWISMDDASGALTGTPEDDDAGAVALDVKVEERNNPTVFDTAQLSFDVLGVMITTTRMPDASISSSYSFQLSAKGGSGYFAWSIDAGSSVNAGWVVLDEDSGLVTGPTPSTMTEVTLAVEIGNSLDPTQTHQAVFRFFILGSILAAGFESGLPAGWSVSAAAVCPWQFGGLNAVFIGPYPAFSGSCVAGPRTSNRYNTNIAWGDGDLTATAIALPSNAGNSIFLTFMHWFMCAPFDGGTLEINDGGWAALTPVSGYPGMIDVSTPGFTGNSGGWRKVVVDLTAHAGSTVSLRWRFFSNAATTGPGWFIDDVKIFEISDSWTPEKTSSPFPADGIAYAPPESDGYADSFTIRWDVSSGATSYEVYVGTSAAAVEAATTASGEHIDTAVANSYTDATGTLFAAGNSYFWRIDAVNAGGATKGDVWTFSAVSPVSLLINEVQACAFSPYYQFVEVSNFTSTSQDISGWKIRTYDSGVLSGTYVFPSGTVINPNEAVSVHSNAATQLGWLTQSPSRALLAWYNIGWLYGYDTGEVILLDTDDSGVDYMGFNVSTSHLPSDLLWFGSLIESTWSNADFIRMSTSDSDQASDWLQQYYTAATPGMRNAGQ